jgi:type II secretory pathway pseudopilin PulG
MTPYKIAALLIAVAVLALASAGTGWLVRGWHDDSKQLKQTRADITTLTNGFKTVIGSSNALAVTIAQRNRDTELRTTKLLTQLGDQRHALNQLRLDIKAIPVGTCQFTPAADGLLQHAYQAAFGADHPAPAPRKAGGRDAAH